MSVNSSKGHPYDKWLNVSVGGHAMWPTDETRVEFGGHVLVLRPGTDKTSQSIHISLHKIGEFEALTLINRFLSVLSWCDDQGLRVLYSSSGSVIPQSQPLELRERGSSFAFPFGRDLEATREQRLALALFREGASSHSTPLAFLSYFKVLNIFWIDKRDTKTKKNQLVEGLREVIPKLTDQNAVNRLRELQRTIIDVPDHLYKLGRCAVAHAHGTAIVDPDDVTDLRRLSQDIWIIRAAARFLIENELKVHDTIFGATTSRKKK